MKLSQKAWEMSSKVIEAIKEHPFNLELMDGTLLFDKFACYIEQDSLYLQDFARCLAIIASKVSSEYTRRFLHYADSTFLVEQEIVHEFFKSSPEFTKTNSLTPATLSYTSYLFRICSNEPVEVGIAALVPCFWVYREIGFFIAKGAKKNNPYERWIETYSSDNFSRTVNEIIGIFDELAKQDSRAIQDKMLDAFYKTTCLEWHFWNDAYNKSVFDDCSLQRS
jgi:thiaminase/transcriptional activator TenA